MIEGSYLIAAVHSIGLIAGWIFGYKKSKEVSELKLVVDSLNKQNKTIEGGISKITKELGIGTEVSARNVIAKKFEIDEMRNQIQVLQENNDILSLQGEYIKNLDKPLIDFYKSGYKISKKKNRNEYDFALRIINVGRRPATKFKHKFSVFEFDSINDKMMILFDKYEEAVNPVPQKNDLKMGLVFEKPSNNREVFLKVNYSYIDVYNHEETHGTRYYRMPFFEFDKELGLYEINFEQKEKIDNHELPNE